MFSKTYTLNFDCELNEAKDAFDKIIIGSSWEVVSQWSNSHALKILNFPSIHDSAYGPAAATTITVDLYNEVTNVRCELVGTRNADGPIQEYILTCQFHKLFEDVYNELKKVSSSWSIFVSYRRDDSDYITDDLCRRLKREYGRRAVFKDTEAIPVGVNFKEYLVKTLAKCKVMLVVIGRDWLIYGQDGAIPRIQEEGDLVRVEIETALKRGIPIIPILVKGALMPRIAELPPTLQNFHFQNGIKIRRDPDFDVDFHELVKRISQILGNLS